MDDYDFDDPENVAREMELMRSLDAKRTLQSETMYKPRSQAESDEMVQRAKAQQAIDAQSYKDRNPPNAAKVASRMLGLSAFVALYGPASFVTVTEWIKQNMAHLMFAQDERSHSVDDEAQLQAKREHLATLGWCLMRGPASLHPSHTPTATQDSLAYLTGLVLNDADAADVLRISTLRSPEALELEKERACAWHWRVRTERMAKLGTLPDSARAAIGDTAALLFKDKVLLEPPVRGDFAVNGVPFSEYCVNMAMLEQLDVAAQARHFAMNWVCGHARQNIWDATTTDT